MLHNTKYNNYEKARMMQRQTERQAGHPIFLFYFGSKYKMHGWWYSPVVRNTTLSLFFLFVQCSMMTMMVMMIETEWPAGGWGYAPAFLLHILFYHLFASLQALRISACVRLCCAFVSEKAGHRSPFVKTKSIRFVFFPIRLVVWFASVW